MILFLHSQDGSVRTGQCRYEWFQTADLVTVTVYAKGVLVGDTHLEADDTSLHGHITYAHGTNVFPLTLNLWRRIDVNKSSVHVSVSAWLRQFEIDAKTCLSLTGDRHESRSAPSQRRAWFVDAVAVQ
jgi:hypothetical protein